MKVRSVLGLAVTVSALVASVIQPASAASLGTVSFGGTFQLTPTPTGARQIVTACFAALAECPNGIPSTGAASGGGSDGKAIDGLYVTVEHSEACAPDTVLTPASQWTRVDFLVHDAVLGTWSEPISATAQRVGSVVVFAGSAIGKAMLTPAGVPACGAPLTFAVTGDVAVTY